MFRQVKYYQLILIITAILLAIWQTTLVSSKEGTGGAASSELSFTTNTGEAVTLPGTTDKFTIVIFWKASSERSLLLVDEGLSMYGKPEFDSVATLYLVNASDPLTVARAAVDFDNPDLPFAHSPLGGFLDRYPLRSLPLTAVFMPDGSVMGVTEGYREGSLAGLLRRLEMVRRMTGGQGGFRLPFDREDEE